MTGYGRSELKIEDVECAIETRSVNNRFLDVSVRLPRKLLEIESRIKKKVKEKLSRGSVEITVSFNSGQKEANLTANLEIANSYKKILDDLRTSLGLKQEVELKDLLQFKDIIKYEQPEENIDELWGIIEKNLNSALQKLKDSRLIEGGALLEDILGRIKSVVEKVALIKEQQPLVTEYYKKKLTERLSKLLEGVKLDQDRLLQEVAILADRSDISEEIVRLESHLKQFALLTGGDGPVGRQLEFMNQEMLREANTIASKANNYEIAQRVVEIKAELEKIREQVQNIE